MGTTEAQPAPPSAWPAKEHVFKSRVPSVPVPDDVTLPEFVLEDAHRYAGKVALVDVSSGRESTYGDVLRDTRRFAKALTSLGLRKGHVVLVVLPNTTVYPVVALGIMAAGGVFSGANPSAPASEIRRQAGDADARLVVADAPAYRSMEMGDLGVPVIVVGDERVGDGHAMAWDGLLAAGDRAGSVLNLEPVMQSDLCALPYSSGTTGTSKGVMLTHRNLVAGLSSTLYAVDKEMVGQVTTLGLMPFFHIYGLASICCAALRNKGKVVVMRRFEVLAFMEALLRHEVTFAPVVPPIMLAMVKDPAVAAMDLSGLKLRAVMTAAAPLAPELMAAFKERFRGVEVQEAYGMTEHSCITMSHGLVVNGQGEVEVHVAKDRSVGFLLPNVEVKFADPETGRSLPESTPGELCVRGQCVMRGYYKNEDATNQTVDPEGWLHTGDIGYIDEDGDVFIIDRIKELIKYKGFQVAPAELEAILLAHPLVQDAAVYPVADEEAGEIPAACVVMATGATESEEEMIKYVASIVASYKKIRILHFVDAIPKLPSGKIMRRVLRDTMAARLKTAEGTENLISN